MTQIRELAADDTALAFAAMSELRTGLTSEDFVRRVNAQRAAGYRLLGVFDDDGAGAGAKASRGDEGGRGEVADGGEDNDGGAGSTGEALAVCGFRVGQNLAWGRHLYVDDLSTLPVARGRGLATALLAWVHAEAARLGCGEVHLESGVQAARAAAHRLYFGQGYRISSYHFMRPVAPDV